MILTRASLGNPVAVLVAVLLSLLFGLVSLFKLPVQLIPETQQPEISISTTWPAAAPHEIEAEILEPQEKVLKGLPGMTELLAKANEGYGTVTVTFALDVPMERALVETINRLNQVPEYPDDAEEPTLSTIGADARPIAWFSIRPADGEARPVEHLREFLRDVVETRFERVPGVANSEIYGGQDREIRVTFDPYKVASYAIQIPAVSRLAGSGKDVSAGGADVGKREYSLRFAGKYELDRIGDLILEWRDGRPVHLRDVARVEQRLKDKEAVVLVNGVEAYVANVQRETGVNVLEVMERVKQAMKELQEGPLARAQMSLINVYDETTYIRDAISLVSGNLVAGALLAGAVLWWFMRRLRPTIIIVATIPIFITVSFLFLYMFDRTINVISLAGLAFSIGIVLDACIIVLENIIRLREQGVPAEQASLQGVDEIWSALIASNATNVAIFLPIVFLEGEVGQIFGDLAIAITATAVLAVLVALTVVPLLAVKVLQDERPEDPHAHWWDWAARTVMRLTDGRRQRHAWAGGLLAVPMLITVALLPKADYLPEGNMNFAFAFVLAPPGINIPHLYSDIGKVVSGRIEPHVSGEKQPKVNNYFFAGGNFGAFAGMDAANPADMKSIVPLLFEVLGGLPDTLGFAQRASLFGNFDRGRTVDMDIASRDLEQVMAVALTAFLRIPEAIPGASARPLPGLELAKPELRLTPDERRIAEAGWDRSTVANIVRALGDGLYVGDYFDGEKTIDIVVRAEPWETPEQLAAIPLVTPGAGTLPLSELVHLSQTSGPEEIRRINARRTVTLRVQPPEDVSLSETIDLLKANVEPEIRPQLPEDGEVSYSGTADKLKFALESMTGSFILAMIILFLLMAALFRSFKDSLLVLMVIPLGTVGGVIMLNLINIVPAWLGNPVHQSLDMLTMIGFVMLLGLVVNNAILLVDEAREAERSGANRRESVYQAVRRRLRPILMTTLTTVFGTLPMLLVPGAGTELYRGLSGIIIGGMFVSTVFTLILLPCLLRMGEDSPHAV